MSYVSVYADDETSSIGSVPKSVVDEFVGICLSDCWKMLLYNVISHIKYGDLCSVILRGGERIVAHRRANCRSPEQCCIHNPTDHCMRKFPQHWRSDRRIMERVCPHGIGHPDPDDWNVRAGINDVHACDGCCWTQSETTRFGDATKSYIPIRQYA